MIEQITVKTLKCDICSNVIRAAKIDILTINGVGSYDVCGTCMHNVQEVMIFLTITVGIDEMLDFNYQWSIVDYAEHVLGEIPE